MKNGNGKVVMYLIGVIVTLVLFIGFPTLVKAVISNDKDSRGRDIIITEKIHKTELDNKDRFEAIMIQLTKIQAKLDSR